MSAELSDLTIQRTVGVRAFVAGMGYARSGRVVDLDLTTGGRLLYGLVQGSGPRPYSVVITTAGDGWSGQCSCPVGYACKHIAAVMIAAQGEPAGPRQSSWEGPLATVVRARTSPPQLTGTPLALQLEVVNGGRVRLRPVVPGRTGNWVRTGASWRDLEHSYGPVTFRPAHRAVLLAMSNAFKAIDHRGYYSYGYRDISLHLDDLGPAVWQLLEQAQAAGIELVPAKGSSAVELIEPVGALLDLRQADASFGGFGGASLRPVVTIDGQGFDATQVTLVGEPPHGLFVTDPVVLAALGSGLAAEVNRRPGLVLAALQTRPDEHVGALLRAVRPLQIPEADLARFISVYYPVLRQAIEITCSDASIELPEVLAPGLALTVRFAAGPEVGLAWTFTYRVGDNIEQVPLEVGPSEPGEPVARDREAERELLAGLPPAARRLLSPGLRLAGMDAVGFSQDLLPVLRAADDVAVSVIGEEPAFRAATLPPVIALSTTQAADDADWFDLGVAVSIDGEEIPFRPLFVALAGGQSHLVLLSGTYFALDRPELQSLRGLIDQARALQDRPSDGVRLSVFQAGLWEELLELGVVEQQSARWAQVMAGLLGVEGFAPPPVPAAFEATLRPYQLDGFGWLAFLWENGLGGVLADDMGLGKTIQTLALFAHARQAVPPGAQASPFLVVAPTSVVGNWAHEAARFAPGLKVHAVTQTAGKRGTPLAEDVAGADLVVTSYALFRIDFEAYQQQSWAGLVLDEAQMVKNHQAKTYQCARRLSAPFKLAVTGTPLENSLMDLWSLLSIVAPGLFPSPQRFAEVYAKPIERGGDPELLATLRRRVRPLMLRRTKEAVAADLPPKQEQVLEVVLNPKHQKIYQTHLQRERQKVLGLLEDLDKNRFAIFRSLTLLRQLALAPSLVDPAYALVPSSKADAFLEQLHEVVAEGHRALVFSQFTGFLSVVRDRLDAEGIDYCYLDGSSRKRPERIAEFKTGTAPVFLISLKAGGVGLNLTEADYVFILDPWWNPAVEAQAVDRTHRIGQGKNVMVYRLVAVGTIEEKVMELKARKQSLFTQVMDDEGLMAAPLSVDDIKALFG